MSAKAILVFCAQALFVQSAFSQCTSRAAVEALDFAGPYGLAGPGIGPLAYDGFAYDGCGAYGYDRFAAPLAYEGLAPYRAFGCGGYTPAIDITPTSGGGLIVTSSSPIPPTGISVISENAYEGLLAVSGEVPFVGTTVMEGIVPTVGAGAVNHACGNGVNAMVSDLAAYAPAPYAPAPFAPTGFAPGYAPTGYPGCGCEYLC